MIIRQLGISRVLLINLLHIYTWRRSLVYTVPDLLEVNAKSRIFRDKSKLLIIGKCIELEHPEILKQFIDDNYGVLGLCPEAVHVNMAGFKLIGILARGSFEEVSVLTVDGSMHCIQLHWMLEEVFKAMNLNGKIKRRHFIIYKGELKEVSARDVKISRFMYKVNSLASKLNYEKAICAIDEEVSS
ncbi:MAG: 4Fe-4S ferredoxin [Desulfurococcaceae archaeon]